MAGWIVSEATCQQCGLEYSSGVRDEFTYKKGGAVHTLRSMGPLRLNDGFEHPSNLTFCGPRCCLRYLRKHWVTFRYTYGGECFECGLEGGGLTVGAPYGSIFDSGSYLAYLCSVRCLKKALRRDDEFQHSGLCYEATGLVLPWYAS